MKRARQIIKDVLAEAKAPAVLCSFGKDSMLLLSLVREVDETVPVIWFRTPNDRFAKKMILDWNLEAWNWEPADVYVLPNETGFSLIREQSFSSHHFPVVLDIQEGEKCIGDMFPERTPKLFPHFDKIFMGYKDTDYHWTFGGSGFCPENGWRLGNAQVFAPLRHLNDEQVWEAIKELDVPYDKDRYENSGSDPDEVLSCTRCLQEGAEVFCPKEQKMIPSITWEPMQRLKEFQQRFGFKEVA